MKSITKLAVNVPKEIDDWVEHRAAQEDRSKTSIIVRVLRQAMVREQHNNKEAAAA